MTLVLFNGQNEVYFLNRIDNAAQSLKAIGGKFPDRLRDLDVSAGDIDTHRQSSLEDASNSSPRPTI
jgi:hypothetical protein